MAEGNTAESDRPGPAAAAVTVTGALLAYAAVAPGVGAAVVAPLAIANGTWLTEHSTAMILPVTAAVAVLCGLALLPTFVATVLLCWLYGPWVGLVLAVSAYCVSSAIGWLASRAIGRRGVEALCESKPQLRVVRDALGRSTFWRSVRTVLLLRLSPVVPFALINAISGSAGVRTDAFVVGTAIGLLPRAALVAAWAAKLERLTFEQPGDWGILAAGVAFTIGVIVLLGWWAKRALRQAGIGSPAPAAAVTS
jgi:uncharacterized membrane protein YdjX (TVP38/TMEM64 family)